METFNAQADWNKVIASLPGAHLLQTWQWGQEKARLGWRPLPHVWRDERGQVEAAALILQRTVASGGFALQPRVLYVPKGPLLDWNNTALRQSVLDDLQTFTRRQGAIFIKIDPDVCLGTGIPACFGAGIPGTAESFENPGGAAVASELSRRGWRFSDEQIQFRNTVLVDLTHSEDDLLARMKQKTRYNIRLAQRKGVTVRPSRPEDLDLLYRMYAETSVRDGFVIRDRRYYLNLWVAFIQAHMAEPLIAEVEGQPVAAVVIFRFAGQAWYLNGMSRDLRREYMPNFLLQWEAMRRAKSAGCTSYDLWGAPDEFVESDPMWGVYRFKEGFNGSVVRTLGAWDYPARPLLYQLYTQLLPRLLNVMRRRGKAKTRQEVSLS
jgi:peptidoglycan pentaglycine glycine transferase (the first glycine)